MRQYPSRLLKSQHIRNSHSPLLMPTRPPKHAKTLAATKRKDPPGAKAAVPMSARSRGAFADGATPMRAPGATFPPFLRVLVRL